MEQLNLPEVPPPPPVVLDDWPDRPGLVPQRLEYAYVLEAHAAALHSVWADCMVLLPRSPAWDVWFKPWHALDERIKDVFRRRADDRKTLAMWVYV